MRTIAIATISFGMLEIPARVYAAVEKKSEISFSLLHDECNSKLKQRYACPSCDVPVDSDNMIKGYEFAKGQFVTVTAEQLEELEALEPAKPVNQTIAISHFVKLAGDVRFAFSAAIERGYFVGAHDGSEKPFVTLMRAMERAEVLAVGRYTTRGRTHQVVLSAHGGCFEMAQLRSAGEVRSVVDVPDVDVEIVDANVELAVKLIAQYTRDELELEQLVDEGERRLQEYIQEKIDAGDSCAAPTRNNPAPITDLCDALEASLKEPEKKKRARRAAVTP